MILKCFLNTAFEKPRIFGIRLKSGVCHPSNQSGTPHPERAFCPLHPLHENVPFPEPFPLQRRFAFLRVAAGELRVSRVNIWRYLVNIT